MGELAFDFRNEGIGYRKGCVWLFLNFRCERNDGMSCVLLGFMERRRSSAYLQRKDMSFGNQETKELSRSVRTMDDRSRAR